MRIRARAYQKNLALKFGVCAKLLNGTVGTVIGNPPNTPCCSVLGGLLEIEAAVCLCTAMKANILGNNINIPISLSLLMNICGKNLPSGFICSYLTFFYLIIWYSMPTKWQELETGPSFRCSLFLKPESHLQDGNTLERKLDRFSDVQRNSCSDFTAVRS
nr:14 kDa proline-rich protein DC2.15-like [Nicotiana tomentosiformis]